MVQSKLCLLYFIPWGHLYWEMLIFPLASDADHCSKRLDECLTKRLLVRTRALTDFSRIWFALPFSKIWAAFFIKSGGSLLQLTVSNKIYRTACKLLYLFIQKELQGSCRTTVLIWVELWESMRSGFHWAEKWLSLHSIPIWWAKAIHKYLLSPPQFSQQSQLRSFHTFK